MDQSKLASPWVEIRRRFVVPRRNAVIFRRGIAPWRRTCFSSSEPRHTIQHRSVVKIVPAYSDKLKHVLRSRIGRKLHVRVPHAKKWRRDCHRFNLSESCRASTANKRTRNKQRLPVRRQAGQIGCVRAIHNSAKTKNLARCSRENTYLTRNEGHVGG